MLIWVLIFMAALTIADLIRYFVLWRAREMPFYPKERPLYMAHRGVPSRAPENTLPAVQEAFRLGMDGIEIDVMETADNELIVKHDHELEGSTDGIGYVWEKTHPTLANLNAAHQWGDRFPHTGIPRLVEVLKALPEHMIVNIELKTRRWIEPGLAEKVVAAIRKYRLVKRTIVSSYNPITLLKVHWLEPEVAIGYIWNDTDVPWYIKRPYFVWLVRPDSMHPSVDVVTPEQVKRAHRRGMRVNVWTVNNRPMVEYLRSIGVDGIFTDFPELLLQSGED